MIALARALRDLAAAEPPADIPGQQRYFAVELPALREALQQALLDEFSAAERLALYDALGDVIVDSDDDHDVCHECGGPLP